MDGSVGVVEWPILILEGREGWEWVRFSGRMGGKEGHPKKNGRYPSLAARQWQFPAALSGLACHCNLQDEDEISE